MAQEGISSRIHQRRLDLCGRIKKDTVEVATGGTWTEHDLGPRPVQWREIRTEGILGDIRG